MKISAITFPNKDLQISLSANSCLCDVQKSTMFSTVKTLFLPFIFTVFIFLYCDIFLLVKNLVINEGANPDLRKHTRTHILHMLQLHGLTGCNPPHRKANQYDLNSPLGHKMGLNAAEPFYFKRTVMSWPVAQLITPQSLGLQSNSKNYPVGKRELRSEESSLSKRNRTVVCFTVSTF